MVNIPENGNVGNGFLKVELPRAKENLVRIPALSESLNVIYCYSIPGLDTHRGLVKVGMTAATPSLRESFGVYADPEALAVAAAHKRIREQTGATGVKYRLEWAAVSDARITDHRVHAILRSDGVENTHFDDSGAREWYRVTPGKAFAAYKAAVARKSSAEHNNDEPIVLRDEQETFVKNTLAAWRAGEGKRLWNAKMRFGKTLTAYSFIERAYAENPQRMRKVLVLTHRPVVNEGWSYEYDRILHKSGWQYGSKDAKHESWAQLDHNLPFIYFASMQDARGKERDSDEFKKSNKEIFETHWDFVLIDEAHEGNQTALATEVHDNLKRDFTLYLSGTPFKYLSGEEFHPEQVDTWDYVDEQKAKENWDATRPGEPNPYRGLPRMSINALEILDVAGGKYVDSGEDVAFDFAKFFETRNGAFTNISDVAKFLNAIAPTPERDRDGFPNAGEEPDAGMFTGAAQMPYASDQLDFTRHALWVFDRVDTCKAMEKLLASHPVFQDYTVVMVAGAGDSEAKNALGRVKNAMGDDPSVTRTITLTVGRLTTGVTVAPWTTVLMLNNGSSAETYMQTIFRTQSPYTNGAGFKTECAVYDFAPDRVLQVLVEATDSSGKTSSGKTGGGRSRLGELLNYLPVISHITDKDVRRFDAGDVVRELNRVSARRVVDNGFDSPFLFTQHLEELDKNTRAALEDIRKVSKGSVHPGVRQKIDPTVVIANNNLSNRSFKQLEEKKKELEKPARKLSKREQRELERIREEQKQRANMRAVLKTISVRLPIMILALMSDPEFRNTRLKKDFRLADLAEKLDEESWKEFFGQITKETFLKLEPAFNQEVLQVSVAAWVEEVEKVLALRDADVDAHAVGWKSSFSKLRNPNKETVLTPYNVVAKVYADAGLATGEDWQAKFANINFGEGGNTGNLGDDVTFYDINVKSGLFSFYAAYNIFKYGGTGKTWEQVCNDHIYANSRTLAGKWITAAILGMPKDWQNITVVDVKEELDREEVGKLSEQARHMFVSRFLLAPLHRNTVGVDVPLPNVSDIENRTRTLHILQEFDKQTRLVDEDGEVGEQEKRTRKTALVEQVQRKLHTDVTFDSVVSNPPYQVDDGGHGASAVPVYHLFVQQAFAMKPRHVAMIMPSRWFAGGKGLDSFRGMMLAETRMQRIVDYPDASECFPGVEIKGGVCYFLWDRDYSGDCEVVTVQKGVAGKGLKRPLGQWDVFIRFNQAVSILEKVEKVTKKNNYDSFADKVSSTKPFGFRTFFEDFSSEPFSGATKIFARGKGDGVPTTGWVEKDKIEKNKNLINTWKVYTSAAAEGGGTFPNKIMSIMFTGEPGTVCTETYLMIGPLKDKTEADNTVAYMRTRMFRFLVMLRKPSQHLKSERFLFVPDLPMNRTWTDKELYKLFNLDAEEISFIENRIREL